MEVDVPDNVGAVDGYGKDHTVSGGGVRVAALSMQPESRAGKSSPPSPMVGYWRRIGALIISVFHAQTLHTKVCST